MKLKGIWITICLIVVAGVCATSYTKQYTSDTVPMRSLEAAMGVPETAAAGGGDLGAAAVPRTASAEGRVAAEGGPVSADSELSKLIAEESTEVSTIMQELIDLDEQIDRSRTGATDTTANAMKASAESERKLWEAKMDRFLDILEKKLSGEERDKLFIEQKEWIRDREADATAASRKQSSSALIELEYNLSLKEITRERVYELVNRYEKELTEG